MSQKKLLIVNSFYYPNVIGGAEISTKLLAEDMNSEFTVCVLTTGKQRNGLVVEKINNVEIWRLPNFNLYWAGIYKKRNVFLKLMWHMINAFNPFQNYLLKKTIKKINPDLIHTQNLLGIGTSVWRVAFKLSIPVLHTLRDYSLFNPVTNDILNRLLSKINRKRAKYVNEVVGISNFIIQAHQRKHFFEHTQSHIIYNIVHTTGCVSIEKKKTSLTVGYFGQLEEIKGIHVFINAVKVLDHSVIDKIIICGKGKQEEKIKKFSLTDNRVEYLSKVSNEKVQELMSQCDLTIVPSVWDEPFGRVIIESYSQGTPVLASRVGGIPEIIVDDHFLFDVNSSEDLTKKIVAYYQLSPKDKKNWAKVCYNFSQSFKENKIEYIHVYNDLLSDK